MKETKEKIMEAMYDHYEFKHVPYSAQNLYDNFVSKDERRINNIWSIAFKDLTEPYMGKQHKRFVKEVQNRVIESRKTENQQPDPD